MQTQDDTPRPRSAIQRWGYYAMAGAAALAVVAVMAWDLGAFEPDVVGLRADGVAATSVTAPEGPRPSTVTGSDPAAMGSDSAVGPATSQADPRVPAGGGEDDVPDNGGGAPPTTDGGSDEPTPTDSPGGGPTSTLPPPPSDGSCISTAGALQSIIDSAPDGRAISNMKGDLVDAASLGFTVIDLSGYCFENQGTITLTGRYGLWLVQPNTYGSNWVLNDVSDTVVSGLKFNGGSLTATGGNQRIEAGTVYNLTIVDQTDFMLGKMTVTGHTKFATMTRVESDKSFARNSTFASVEVTGAIHGFKIENSTATSLVNTADPAENLVLQVTLVG